MKNNKLVSIILSSYVEGGLTDDSGNLFDKYLNAEN